ncbi:hypothetical protein QJQ45_006535 [Haematococcus lacustris]|nr:hypothetical protein QJQ45_006535 [Haematococcus lacustris]
MVEEMSQGGHASANCSSSDPPRGLVLIGAGFARTGTMSTKAALEELLHQPVYHMLRYKELLAEFPEAKVLLTVRNTVYQAMTEIQSSSPKGMVGLVEAYWGQRGLFQGKFEDKEEARKVGPAQLELHPAPPTQCVTLPTVCHTSGAHQGKERPSSHARLAVAKLTAKRASSTIILRPIPATLCADKAVMPGLQLHDAFLEEVQRVVPADRLLVFNVKQGWAPLCAFLGVPVPDDKPFPRLNDTAEFHNNVKKITATAQEPLEASH